MNGKLIVRITGNLELLPLHRKRQKLAQEKQTKQYHTRCTTILIEQIINKSIKARAYL